MMLAQSPALAPSVTASPRSGFLNLHYAPASSPRQSPSSWVSAALSRRKSPSPAAASTASPSLARVARYVDAATQYSPMEPFDYAAVITTASRAPAYAPETEPAPAPAPSNDAGLLETPPPPRTPAMTVRAEQLPVPGDAEPTPTKVVPDVPSVIKPHPSLPADSAVQPLSPSKRKNSAEPSSSTTLTGLTESPSSISKRAKPDVAPPKLLPQKYELCAVEDMVVLIAHMLGELIETNDALALRTGHLTRFHSRTPPGISVIDYLQRLAKHATLTPPLLLSMVYYIDRLCALYPEFTINTLTVHRFLITAATVAAKGLSDAFWNNSTYAKVGGIKVAELKLLELEFLHRVDWRIVPDPEVLVAYYRGLVERCPGFALEEEPAAATEEDEDVSDSVDEVSDGTGEATEMTAETTETPEESAEGSVPSETATREHSQPPEATHGP